jgi:hypothetical protein
MDGVVVFGLLVHAWIVLFRSSISVVIAMMGDLVRRVLQDFALADQLLMFSVFCPRQMGSLPWLVSRQDVQGLLVALGYDGHDGVVEGVNGVLCTTSHITCLKLCDVLWSEVVVERRGDTLEGLM